MDAAEYSKYTQLYTDDVPEMLSSILRQRNWESCIDLGCGDGALLRALTHGGYLEGKSVHAVDLSESRLELVSQINPEIICLTADACDVPVPDSSVDVVMSTQVIEHVEDDAKMAKEFFRIAAPNATVYVATIFKKWYGWYFYRCNGKWTIDPTHVREYNKDSQLLDALTDAGLEIVDSKKTLDGRSIMDAGLKRLKVSRTVYDNKVLKRFRSFRLPIPGYYIWEVVCKKKPTG